MALPLFYGILLLSVTRVFTRAGGRLWDIDTGHDLMITEPRQVVDALLQVAAHGG
jgi:hypothetical protein